MAVATAAQRRLHGDGGADDTDNAARWVKGPIFNLYCALLDVRSC